MALEINRHIKGEHRSWWVRTIPGTDNYTVHAWPTPAYGGNDAAAIEDGVFLSIRHAYTAMLDAEDCDNGMHEGAGSDEAAEREYAHTSEREAHAHQRRLIDRGFSVTLIGYDGARDVYAFGYWKD